MLYTVKQIFEEEAPYNLTLTHEYFLRIYGSKKQSYSRAYCHELNGALKWKLEKNYLLLFRGTIGNILFFEEDRKQLLKIDEETGQELGDIPLNNKAVNHINEFGILVYERENDETAHPAFYDFDLNKKWGFEEPAQVKPIRFTSSFFVSKKLIELGGGCQLVDNSSLTLIELSSGAKLWKFENAFLNSLNGKKPEIKSALGVFQDMLLLNTDENILELHLSSGKLKRHWSELPKGISWSTHPHLPPSTLIPGVNRCALDSNSGKIVGLSSWFFWEIDLESGAITFHDLRETFERNELHCSGPIALQGDHVFFLSDALLFRGAPWKVAALNRKTLEVDWFYEFPKGTRIHARGPQVQGKHLFVVDYKNNLHLFERTG